MYKGQKVAVVIPAYNEAPHIIDVVNTVPKYIDMIVVVDDCSTDRTKSLTLADCRATFIRNEKNLGVGGSILVGHQTAMDSGADISVVMAGDGQMNPRYMPRLLDAVVDGYDYAKGNRFGDMRGMPKIRILGNFGLSLLTKIASGYWGISDPQNGYTALKMDAFSRLDVEHIVKRWQFENDMLVHLAAIGARVKDISIPSEYHGEKSKLKTREFVLQTVVLLGLRFFWRRKAKRRYERRNTYSGTGGRLKRSRTNRRGSPNNTTAKY